MKYVRFIVLIVALGLVACGGGQADEAVAPPVQDVDMAVDNTTGGDTTAVSTTAAPRTTDSDSETSVEVTRFPAEKYADLEIVTLLPRDAIPAIDNPRFLSIPDADDAYDADELVIGVAFDGEARAYSVPFLSSHEIVNDTVGGVKIAVTW